MVACPYCGIPIAESPNLAGQIVACPGCGKQFPMPPPTAAPEFAPVFQASQGVNYRPESKNPGIAALVSFVVPGGGQIFNGQIGKGIMMCCLWAIGIFFSMFIIGIPLLLGVWAWAIYDAYSVAENPPSRYRRRY